MFFKATRNFSNMAFDSKPRLAEVPEHRCSVFESRLSRISDWITEIFGTSYKIDIYFCHQHFYYVKLVSQVLELPPHGNKRSMNVDFVKQL